MRIDLFIHSQPDPRLDLILEGVDRLTQGAKTMSQELDALKAEVAKNTQVEAGAVALIQGLASKLDAAKSDPAAIAALSAELRSSASALAAAVAANTDSASGGVATSAGAVRASGTGAAEVAPTAWPGDGGVLGGGQQGGGTPGAAPLL